MEGKSGTAAKQPFMFPFRVFLLRCCLESALPVPAAWGTLRTIEVFWGLLGFSVVKTGLKLGHSEDYWGLLRSFDATRLFPGQFCI